MTLAEKVFALHAVFPFSQLRSEELLIVATAFQPRSFGAGRLICPRGEPLNRLYVKVDGDLVDERGIRLPAIVGTASLLAGQASPVAISTGPEGYRALLLARGKLFTVVNECPILLAGFFQIPLAGIDEQRATSFPP